MNAEKFAALFDTEVRSPLEAEGFKSSGKSLFQVAGPCCLSLIRLGGRFASPGGIPHLLCFRPTFLRTLKEVVAPGFVSEAFSHPYKLLFADFLNEEPIRYRPANLNYAYDRMEYDGVPAARLRRTLREMRATILERVWPWARSFSPRDSYEQIRAGGGDAWVERMWLQDYRRYFRSEKKTA